MQQSEWKDTLLRAELSLNNQVACNKLLIFFALLFAGSSLLLAAALGYLLGRQAATKVPSFTHWVSEAFQGIYLSCRAKPGNAISATFGKMHF